METIEANTSRVSVKYWKSENSEDVIKVKNQRRDKKNTIENKPVEKETQHN